MNPDTVSVWNPQPKQKILLDCTYPLVLFGGARGGGKTSGILGKYGVKASLSKHTNAIFFRQEMPQADDLIEEAKDIYCRIGARWRDQRRMFEFENGARIRFRPLETEKDAAKYQGQNVSDAAIEEAGNYPDKAPIFKMFGCLRSKVGLLIQLILTANPGGVGHMWIKELFIDPAPLGMKTLTFKLPSGSEVKYIYIPSRIIDNQILIKNDPTYVDRLHLVGSEALVKAWLDGDWSVIEGAFFNEFSIPKHVIPAMTLPKRWKRYVGYDWGFNSPACAIWGAVSDGKDDAGNEVKTPDGRHIPKGAIVFYREQKWRMTPNADMAREIRRLSEDEDVSMFAADPSIFNSNGGDTIADDFQNAGLVFMPADNERVAGWTQYRKRMRPSLDPSIPPMLYVFETMPYLIQTISAAPIDKKRPEDLDTQFDDHGLDAGRYLLMENLLVRTSYQQDTPVGTKGVISIGAMIDKAKRARTRTRI